MKHKPAHALIIVFQVAIIILVCSCIIPKAVQSPVVSAAPVSTPSVPTALTLSAPTLTLNVLVIATVVPGLPNPLLSPGSIDPRVTQANISMTICRKGGYASSVRPPKRYYGDTSLN
jgi:hypothetical protein